MLTLARRGLGRGVPALFAPTALAALLTAAAFGARSETLADGEAAGPEPPPTGIAQPAAEYSDCEPSTSQLAFEGGFSVGMCFEHEKDGATVRADALDYGLGSGKSGLLYFFERDNAEVLVKVLDGCAVNGHRWAFVAPVTTLAFNLRIVEAATGRVWEHRNPRGGGTATAKSDLAAFPCSAASSGFASAPGAGGPAEAGSPALVGAAGAAGPAAGALTDLAPASVGAATSATCVPRPVATLDGGFSVDMCVEYERDGRRVVGAVKDYGLDSGRSALLYFFERDNAEVLVKVLDGCAINGRRWVFVAPVTTLAFNLSIAGPGGVRWNHWNGAGQTAVAKSDPAAFSCADAPGADPGGGTGGGEDRPDAGDAAFQGRVVGYYGDWKDVEVLLTAKGVLRSATPDNGGWFAFRNVARGKYAIKVHARGYRATPARLVELPWDEDYEGGVPDPFDLTPIPTDPFVFHWEEDQSTAGTEYAAAVNRPVDVTFEGEPATAADNSSSNHLLHKYNMTLVDTDRAQWTQEHAWRLLTTMEAIPQPERDFHESQDRPPSQWVLTPEHLTGDIEVARRGGNTVVRIAEAAFVNAAPRVARVDGKRGIWFSKRLHHALVRYVTDNGRDEKAYERIFKERFGVTTAVPDYAALTAHTTGEDAGKFQKFHAREIVALLTALEEFPSGMRKTPGLDYLVRRRDGLDHPIYPTAGAVAWTTEGYIEFMEKGLRANIDFMHRLILHEKAHFLWEHAFDRTTKHDWIEIGGWYETGDGWQTTKQTEFVSAYAHAKNPNEDMAETVAFFVFNPDKLRSRSPAKYEFVRDRIMQGNLFVSRIREDLTFTVYNLFPDYVYPGKVRRIDISVAGRPEEEKRIRIELELHALDRVVEGASSAYSRIFSESGTYFDLYLFPRDATGRSTAVGTVLVGEHTLGPTAKAGYWIPDQIKITDQVGNERYTRGDDFGWKLFVDNPGEDWTPPEYVRRSARLVHGGHVMVEGRSVQLLEAGWGVEEDRGMMLEYGCYAALNDEIASTYSFQEYDDFVAASKRCEVTFVMPEYMPSSTYSLNRIKFWDAALNEGAADFTESALDESPPRVRLVTTSPDTEPPELDLNRIEVEAEPTNPEAPNGETIVRLTFRVRDNISGHTHTEVNLRDPQGVTHFFYVYDSEKPTWFPSADPKEWKTYKHEHVLPAGSAPGLWGIYDMTLVDRARNFISHDFTEVLRFEVE